MISRRRIAFVSTMSLHPWGGSEELWSRAALELRKRGITVGANVIGWPEFPNELKKLQREGCQIVRRGEKLKFHQKLSQAFKGIMHTWSKWLSDFKPDLVVISQGSNTEGLDWMEECINRAIPFVTISQAASALSKIESSEIIQRFAHAYSSAEICFFVSKMNLEDTKHLFSVPLNNARIIRNPFQVRYDASPPWPNENSTFKLACVARLDTGAKGQDILMVVMNMSKWRQRPLELTLYGEGFDYKMLRELKEKLNLDKVKFAGFVSDVEAIWASHHTLILPSRVEGLPLALVEAMLCARPCIVTNVGGNAELLEDNVSGFIAAAPKPECLDEALERAWQCRSQWKQIGQLAAKKVREIIPPDPIGEFLRELLQVLS